MCFYVQELTGAFKTTPLAAPIRPQAHPEPVPTHHVESTSAPAVSSIVDPRDQWTLEEFCL